MKKMFVIAAMFAAASMVACCGEQKAKEAEACCEKTECAGECAGECEKAEAECCGECAKTEEAAPEAPAAE